jgi:hypothetical protein
MRSEAPAIMRIGLRQHVAYQAARLSPSPREHVDLPDARIAYD